MGRRPHGAGNHGVSSSDLSKGYKMKKLALIAAAGLTLASLGFSAGAFAQAAPSFVEADSDHDGFVDFNEAQASYPGLGQQAFDQADTNKDGKLDEAEYMQLGGMEGTTNMGTDNAPATEASPASETPVAITAARQEKPPRADVFWLSLDSRLRGNDREAAAVPQ